MRLLIYPLLYRSYGYTYSPCLPFYRVHAVVSARVMRSDEAVVPVVEAFEPC